MEEEIKNLSAYFFLLADEARKKSKLAETYLWTERHAATAEAYEQAAKDVLMLLPALNTKP